MKVLRVRSLPGWFVLVMAAFSALADSSPDEPASVKLSEALPRAAIGLLNTVYGSCPAVLISKDVVIAARACVCNKSLDECRREFSQESKTTFLPGYDNSRATLETRVMTTQVDFSLEGPEYALFRLANPMSELTEWLQPSRISLATIGLLTFQSYSQF